jgi:hypothetical protein
MLGLNTGRFLGINSETRGVGAFQGDVWHRSHYADLAFGSDPAIDDERTFPGSMDLFSKAGVMRILARGAR